MTLWFGSNRSKLLEIFQTERFPCGNYFETSVCPYMSTKMGPKLGKNPVSEAFWLGASTNDPTFILHWPSTPTETIGPGVRRGSCWNRKVQTSYVLSAWIHTGAGSFGEKGDCKVWELAILQGCPYHTTVLLSLLAWIETSTAWDSFRISIGIDVVLHTRI